MSDQPQNGSEDPNAPKNTGEAGTPQAAPDGAKPFYLRPPFMAGAGVAIVAIVAAAFLIGPSGEPGSEPEAIAEASDTANDMAGGTNWELGRPGDIVMGSPTAPVKLVEYASVTCGHCAAFKLAVFPDIKKKYIDTGLVQYTLREFPTPPVSLSIAGFMLARCTGEQRYYQALEALFRTQPVWVKPNPQEARGELAKISRQFGLNEAEFEACIENEQELKRIRTVVEAGTEVYGINSTPSFVINGRKAEIRGASFEALDSLIQEHLPEGTEVPEYTPSGFNRAEPGQPDEGAGDTGEDDGAAADEGDSEDGESEDGAADDGSADEDASDDGASEEDASDEGSAEDGAASDESTSEDGESGEEKSDEGASDEASGDDESTDGESSDDSGDSSEDGEPK